MSKKTREFEVLSLSIDHPKLGQLTQGQRVELEVEEVSEGVYVPKSPLMRDRVRLLGDVVGADPLTEKEAKGKAKEILDEAKLKADKLVQDAETKAKGIVEKAEAEALAILTKANGGNA